MRRWFVAEWTPWYGPGGAGDAATLTPGGAYPASLASSSLKTSSATRMPVIAVGQPE